MNVPMYFPYLPILYTNEYNHIFVYINEYQKLLCAREGMWGDTWGRGFDLSNKCRLESRGIGAKTPQSFDTQVQYTKRCKEADESVEKMLKKRAKEYASVISTYTL